MQEEWTIYVSRYGSFRFTGSEAEAEAMRKHKAEWEGGAGLKFRTALTNESDRLKAEMISIWARGKGVPHGLLSKMKKAEKLEATRPEVTP